MVFTGKLIATGLRGLYGPGKNQSILRKYYADLVTKRTKLYSEGKKFRTYLDSDLKPYSSAEKLAKDELAHTPLHESFPDLAKILPSYTPAGLRSSAQRAKNEIVGLVRKKPLSYLSRRNISKQSEKTLLPGGTIPFPAEQKRRLAYKNLWDFLKKDEKNLTYFGIDLANIKAFKDIVPTGASKQYIAEAINNFRRLKNLPRPKGSKLNPHGLTREEALIMDKADPQLTGLWNLGKERPLSRHEGKLTGILSPLKKRKEWKDGKWTGKWTDQTPNEYYRGMLERNIKGKKALSRMHEKGFQHVKDPIPPQALSTQHRNNIHRGAEKRLRELDGTIKQNPGDVRIKAWKKEMDEIGEDMKLLGLQSDIGGKPYGKWYAKPGDSIYRQVSPFFKSLKKEHPLKQLEITGPLGKKEKYKYSGYDEGGLVNGYAGGGLIKKLLGESLGMMSRRKFMKGVGATAAAAAIPKSAMRLAAPAAKKAALSFAPPWVNGMLSALKSAPLHTAAVDFARLGNNASVAKIGSNKLKLYGGKTGTETHFRVKSSDMVEADKIAGKADDFWDDIVLREEPGETTITWKNQHYDHGNDQHIVIDKVNKETRFVDDNWHMEAGGEDIAKDDWIEYSISPKDIKNSLTTSDIPKGGVKIPEGKITDDLIDYHSVNEMDNSYSSTFQSYVDSFSPSGNVFGTVEKMRKMLNKPMSKEVKEGINKMQKTLDVHQENKMLDWEEQFRAGSLHGYAPGGMVRERRKLGKRSDQAVENRRMTRLRNMSDVEAMARMMHAESSPGGGGNLRDAQAIGHLIQNRASYQGPESTYGIKGTSKNLSPIKRVLAGQGQFTPFRSEKNLNFWDFDMTEENDYYKYAAQILRGNAEDFTGGATMFDKDPGKYSRGVGPPGRGYTEPGYNKYWNFNPSQFEHEGPHSFWGITPRMNKGGMAEKFSVDDAVAMIRANPQNFAGGGIVMKFAPKVLGKLTQYATRARPAKGVMSKKPWAVMDRHGNPVKDFRGRADANEWLKRKKDVDPINQDKYYEDIIDYKVAKKEPELLKGTKYGDPDKPGAIFWGSREKIIASPQEGMTGQQWLDYLMGMKPQAVFKEAETNLRMVMAEGKGIRENFGGLMKMHRGNSSHPDVIAASKLLQAHKLKVKQANDTLARLKLEQRASAGVTDETRRVSQELPAIRHEELNDTSLAPLLSQYKNKIIPKKVLADAFDRIAPKMDVEVAGREIGGEMMEKLSKSIAKIDPQAYRDPRKAGFFRLLKSSEEQLNRGLKEGAEPFFRTEADSILKNVDNYIFDNYGIANALDAGVPKNFPFDMKKMVAQLSSAAGKRTAGLKEYAGKPQFAGTQTLGGGENPRELLFRYTPGSMRKGEPVYKYAHEFRMSDKAGENAFVHMRMTDRTDELGNRILFIEEIQSDMHQPINAALRSVKRMAQEGKPPVPGTLKESRYAPRGDVPRPVSESDKVNEAQLKLIIAKIEDLGAKPQTAATQKRIAKLNRERNTVRKIIDASKKKALPATTKVPQGPYSRTEDYNEFVIKYATKMGQEGGYDGVAVATSAIKNRGLRPTDDSFHGNLVAYGPMMQGAMKKVSKKSGAKIIETSIIDDKGVGWKVPMIYLKGNNEALFNIQKGLPAYKRGGIAAHGRQ